MPERPMSHVIFGRPAFRCPNSSTFGLAQLLQKSFFIEMALLQEIEDDGLKGLCGHGSILSYFATTYALVKVSHEKRSNLARISGSWMRRHSKALPSLTLGRRTGVLHQLRVRADLIDISLSYPAPTCTPLTSA